MLLMWPCNVSRFLVLQVVVRRRVGQSVAAIATDDALQVVTINNELIQNRC